ncbi:formylglycine-generating enzyme family protein [Thermoleptolyngbya oregonensis]|uniref:formylglycine-generating enzyme family protein n=1 Tax=Thermoleptolyngbya oregonensis TaxID=2303529 RepID=UPI003B3A135A
MRGGSWNNNPAFCRSANRNRNTPHNRNNNIGFRVVCVFPCTLWCQSRWMAIRRACERESRPAPAMFAIQNIQKSTQTEQLGKLSC